MSGVATRPGGGLLALWLDFSPPTRLLLQGFSADDQPTAPFVVRRGGIPTDLVISPLLAGNAQGNSVVVFPLRWPQVRRYGFAGGPQRLVLAGPNQGFIQGLAIDSRGDFVVVWWDGLGAIRASLFSATGAIVRERFVVNTLPTDNEFPRVAMSATTGGFVVAWARGYANSLIEAQIFSPAGEPVGPELQLAASGTDSAAFEGIGMAPDGSFVVAWDSADRLLGERFAADGTPIGATFWVNQGRPTGRVPQIAFDASGNFVIVWERYCRLYRAQGMPVAPPVALTSSSAYAFGRGVAFGDNGIFAVGLGFADFDHNYTATVQRFSASPGDEFCVFDHGVFLCDTGRTGGAPEITYPFGLASDTPLLADVDGDGRADACVYREGVFHCDTGHASGQAPTLLRFGQPGDVPLLGDVDGDHRADPCVYRAGTFLCDSAHDGHAQAQITFGGQVGDIPLLGDIDGDGRADPCVYRQGIFLCDTHHDGTVGVELALGGKPGDIPLLGDFDGDGRADPCIYRAGRLLCDTAHNGTIGGRLAFGAGRGTPLLGNLDGL